MGTLTGADIRMLMKRAVVNRFEAERAPEPIQWLSDNGSMYTAFETVMVTEGLNLVPVTTPAYSPQSNGMSESVRYRSESLVNSIKRDYAECAELPNAAEVLRLLPEWIADYNTNAPHSALGMKSPAEFRQIRAAEEAKKSLSVLL